MIPAIITPVKLFSPFSCTVHGKCLSLPCLNHKSGTDAADSRRLFLYPRILKVNTTAPCRVTETSRKPRFYELRQHVAQFLFCLNHKVMSTITISRTHRCALAVKAWLGSAKQKLFSPFSCTVHGKYLSLPCQNYFSGTDAADSRRLFLYPHVSKINTTAPCRVCGNAPGSPAEVTSTTRSAVSLCQNISVMSTITISRTRWCTLAVKAWLGKKNEWFSAVCGDDFTNKHVLLAQLYCIALIAACSVAQWLEGGAL